MHAKYTAGRRAGLYEVCVRNQDDVLVAVFQGRSSALDKSLLQSLAHGDGRTQRR